MKNSKVTYTHVFLQWLFKQYICTRTSNIPIENTRWRIIGIFVINIQIYKKKKTIHPRRSVDSAPLISHLPRLNEPTTTINQLFVNDNRIVIFIRRDVFQQHGWPTTYGGERKKRKSDRWLIDRVELPPWTGAASSLHISRGIGVSAYL